MCNTLVLEAKEPYKRDDILQKRPTILRSLGSLLGVGGIDQFSKLAFFEIRANGGPLFRH